MPRRARVTLFKRADSPYWFLKTCYPDGRTERESTRRRDQGAAEVLRAARELELARADAGIPVAKAISVLDATAEYLALQEVDWSSQWWATVEGFVRLQVLPWFGQEVLVAAVGSAEVERFRAAQVSRPNLRFRSSCCRRAWRLGSAGAWVCEKCSKPWDGSNPIARSTVNRLLWAMGAFGAWCVERRYHLSNPWSQESFAEDALPPPTVSEDELARVFEALERRTQTTFPWRALFEFARETGLRRSELARLGRADVELGERRAWVVSSNRRGHNKAQRLRSVALTARALEVLEALPERKDGLVFGPIPDARRAFVAAAKGAGLERVWLHLMRHVGATETGRAGASLADLMAFGGWASPRMAHRYSHSDHRRQLEIAERRDAARGVRSPRKGPATSSDPDR
jgi:integrase